MDNITQLKEVFVQVGVTAMRDISGAFLPSEPIYKKVLVPVDYKDDLVPDQKNLMQDISGFFYDKFKKEYDITANGITKKAV